MSRFVLGLVVAWLTICGSLAGGFATAATWADAAFPVKTHDFGTVAVAAKTEFLFPVVNNSQSAMHLSSVRASCGCTTPTIQTNYLQPGQTGFIKAQFNTNTFRGKKGATVTVVIDQPQYAEVQLKVDGYIRSDMVFHPGSLDFGKVTQGEPLSKSTKVLYAGRSDWQVVDVRTNKPWLLPQVKETVRNGGTINYEISIQVLENAPEGYFQDEVVVITNDRNKPNVPLRISGQVESVLTLSPQSIALGSLKPGETVTSKLVLIGKQPFQVESMTAEGWKIDFDGTSEAKKMHVLRPRLTFMGNQSGPSKVSLVIKTTGQQSVTAKSMIHADIRGE